MFMIQTYQCSSWFCPSHPPAYCHDMVTGGGIEGRVLWYLSGEQISSGTMDNDTVGHIIIVLPHYHSSFGPFSTQSGNSYAGLAVRVVQAKP